jgi:diguanylate cyclase (GGDEF)-like protein
MLPDPNAKSITEIVLTAGHALAIDDVYHTPYLNSRTAAFYPICSLFTLPLIVDDQKLGAVIISFNQTHHFDSDEVQLGEQAARQIALGMIKIKLYETEKKRAAQLAALQTISQVVVSSLDLKRIFETVVNVLKETFGYHFVSIYHLEGETLRLGTQIGSPDDAIFEEISLDQGVSGRAVRTRQPQFVPDVQADPDYLRINADIKNEICVPLIKEQTVFGILNVEATAQRPLAESDVTLLSTFANQVAVAIDNARLFKAERDQHDLADALRDVGMALSESLDFETVLERLLDEILGVVPYDRAFVLLLDSKHARTSIARVRVLEQFRKETGSLNLKLELDLSKMANFQEMLKTGKPLAIPDTKNNPIWTKTAALTPVRSWVGAPISFQNQVSGFLSLDSLKSGFYNPEHAERLALFARQAAVSIENARLFTETQQQAQKERLLFMATRDFTARLGEDAVLQAVVRHMTSAFELGGCAISKWDPEKDLVATLLDYTTSTGVLLENPRITYPLDDYPQSRFVIESQQSLSMHVDDPAIDPNEFALLKEYGNDSLLMLPVIIGQGKKVFGIVELYGKAGCAPFTEEEIELAESLVAQAAAAVENARLYSEVQRLAIIDELTGLYNRRGFFRIGEREWERSIRLERPLAALFLDIDQFKQFNDTYSYAVGDQVLRLLADCLRDNLRKVDIAGRYGGEEFVVLLPETSVLVAKDVAERLRIAANSVRVKSDFEDLSITISVGVCQKTPDLTDLDGLIARAGEALKHAKNLGRNQVIISHSMATIQRNIGNGEILSIPDIHNQKRVE